MDAVRKAGEGTDAAAIERALEQLTQAQHKAAESLYQQQSAGGGAAGGPGCGDGAAGQARPAEDKKSGDVIDAEVVDEGKS